MMREFTVNITTESSNGRFVAYIVEALDSGQMAWLDDAEFGPFDTGLDLTRWLCRALDHAKAFTAR
jgi:hypothetical protein